MSAFFYTRISEAIDESTRGDSTLMKSYYAVPLDKMKQWCYELIDDLVSDEILADAIINDIDTYEIWRFIQNNCYPDPNEEEETSSESSEASCAHA